MLIHLRINVTVGDEKVWPNVVVEVEKLYPEAQERNAHRTTSRVSGQIGELAIVVVVVEVVGVVGEIGFDDVGPAIMIVVGGIDAHPGLLTSVAAIRDPRLRSHF